MVLKRRSSIYFIKSGLLVRTSIPIKCKKFPTFIELCGPPCFTQLNRILGILCQHFLNLMRDTIFRKFFHFLATQLQHTHSFQFTSFSPLRGILDSEKDFYLIFDTSIHLSIHPTNILGTQCCRQITNILLCLGPVLDGFAGTR